MNIRLATRLQTTLGRSVCRGNQFTCCSIYNRILFIYLKKYK